MQNQTIYMNFSCSDVGANGTVYMTPEIPQPNSAYYYYIEELGEVRNSNKQQLLFDFETAKACLKLRSKNNSQNWSVLIQNLIQNWIYLIRYFYEI